MPVEKRVMLTIITESTIEEDLLSEIETLGVRAWTVTDARGRGHRGVRNANWQETSNVRIEIILCRSRAEQVILFLKERFYNDYAMITFLQEVEVLRPDKFV